MLLIQASFRSGVVRLVRPVCFHDLLFVNKRSLTFQIKFFNNQYLITY